MGNRMAFGLGACLLVLGMARADESNLCSHCQGMMFTMDVGTCTDCGADTSSGSFRLCVACSRAQRKCQACGASLGPQPVPPGPPSPKGIVVLTQDGFRLACTIYPSQIRTLKGVAILAHMLGGTREDWKECAEALSKAGFLAVTYDLRGHGESTTKKGYLKPWKEFSDQEFREMNADIVAVRKEVASMEGLSGKPFVIIGASIGANVALNYAVDDAEVDGVVMLSPGLEYHGVTTEDAMEDLGERAVFLVASRDDRDSAEAVAKLAEIAQGPKKVAMYKGAGHGTKMFGKEDDHPANLVSAIVDWMEEIPAK